MNTQRPTPPSQLVALKEIALRFSALDWAPRATTEEIDRLHERMPTREADEPVADWLCRGLPEMPASPDAEPRVSAHVVPFVPRPRVSTRVVGEAAMAWAAADLPEGWPALPERLRIGDMAFFVTPTIADGRIHVLLQALGRTLVRLRGRTIWVTGPGGEGETIAELTLGPTGSASFEVEDGPEMRTLLLRMQVREQAED